MSRVLVVVSGGVVLSVHTDDPDLEVKVLDYDEVQARVGEDLVEYLTELGDWVTGLADPIAETRPDDIAVNRQRLPGTVY